MGSLKLAMDAILFCNDCDRRPWPAGKLGESAGSIGPSEPESDEWAEMFCFLFTCEIDGDNPDEFVDSSRLLLIVYVLRTVLGRINRMSYRAKSR